MQSRKGQVFREIALTRAGSNFTLLKVETIKTKQNMTRKHFEAFAREIALVTKIAGYDNTAKYMTEMVIKIARADNSRFDKARFLKACGL